MNNIYTAETDSGRKEDWKTHTWFFLFCFFPPLSHTFSQNLRYYRHLPLFSFLPQRTLQIPLNLMTSLFLLPWPVLWPTEKISLLSRCISIIVCHSKESLSVSLTIFSLSQSTHKYRQYIAFIKDHRSPKPDLGMVKPYLFTPWLLCTVFLNLCNWVLIRFLCPRGHGTDSTYSLRKKQDAVSLCAFSLDSCDAHLPIIHISSVHY